MAEQDPLNPRSSPKQSRSSETVRAILEAAARVLEKFRLDEASTNKIAKIAGVGIGTLYQYFPNKESLASLLFDREVEKHVKTFQALCEEMKARTARDLLKRFAEETVNSYMKKRVFLRAVFEHIFKFAKVESIIEARNQVIATYGKEFERRKNELKPLDFNRAAFVLIHSTMGILEAILFTEPLPHTFDDLKAEIENMSSAYLLRADQ